MKSLRPLRHPIRFAIWSLTGQQVVASVVLLCISVAITGIPIVSPDVRRSGLPFPCQDSSCGCASAEQCWANCCCNTHAQKLAWAKRNQIQPPAFLYDLVERERREELALVRDTSRLITTEGAACCQVDQGNANCCGQCGDNKTVSGTSRSECPECQTPRTLVVFFDAMSKCHGATAPWMMLASGWIPNRPALSCSDQQRILYRFAILNDRFASAFHAPDPPVPWPCGT